MSPNSITHDEVTRYLARDQADLLDELSVYAEQAERVRKSPAEAWARLTPLLRKAICDEWRWCERRQDDRFNDQINLVFAVAEALIGTTLPWGVPVALVVVILVKFGLDKFCACP